MKEFIVDSIDGRIFYGNAKEIVLSMVRQDFICSGKSEYMKEVKAKVKLFTGKEIVVNEGEFTEFLKSLEDAGIVRINDLH